MDKYLVGIYPDGRVSRKPLTDLPTLEELKEIVGGWIETVPFFDKFEGHPCVAFCNEEGKLHHLPVNPLAQAMWTAALGHPIVDDFLVGPVVIIVGPRSFLREL